MSDYLEQAKARVKGDHDLKSWYDILIDYDWANYEEHIEWVATGDRDGIIDWCIVVSRDNI